MMQAAISDEAPARAIVLTLLPFTLAIFLGFLAVGLPVAVLPPYVHGALGFGSLVVGVIVGLRSAATLLTRSIAGRLSDTHGARPVALLGLVVAYAALALGAPVGVAIEANAGFAAVAARGAICPLAAIALTFRWRAAWIAASEPVSVLAAFRRIWTQGVAMALASSGVGTMTAFLALRYQGAGWSGPGLALFDFGMAYLAMRFLFGGLPDRLGGYRTALLSLLAEAIGLCVIWRAPTPLVALAGTTLTGLGYSLVFPSLGVEAMRRVSSDSRGLVLGIYLACFDLGLAMAGPIAGLVTEMFDLPAAFAAAAVAALAGLVLTAVSAAGE